jgi:hypothetical protein
MMGDALKLPTIDILMREVVQAVVAFFVINLRQLPFALAVDQKQA